MALSMSLYTATITLVIVMDPLGNVPVFLSILKSVDPSRHRAIILRETFIALLVLTCFLFFGKYILQGMRISEPALSISGGILLFVIAIRMIFPQTQNNGPASSYSEEPFIVPLAIPMIAGPSTLTVVMLLGNQNPGKIWTWLGALLLAWLISSIILVFADQLKKVLRERGLTAMERLMGMVLTTMAVQMFLTGVSQFIAQLH